VNYLLAQGNAYRKLGFAKKKSCFKAGLVSWEYKSSVHQICLASEKI
jgi:hypothetical protein